MAAPGGPDGAEIERGVAGHLDHLSQLCRRLAVPDPVEDHFSPIVGRWSALHAEADRWRELGASAEEVTTSLSSQLGGLDAAWQGAGADSFIDHMRQVGLAGHDLADAMTALASALDTTADGIREIARDLAAALADAAEAASEAMAVPNLGDERVRLYLDTLRRPTSELYESARQVLEAFVRLCEGIDGPSAFGQPAMAHAFPVDNWSMPAVPPSELGVAAGGGAGGGVGGAVPSGGAPSSVSQVLESGGFVTAVEYPAAPTAASAPPATGGAAAAHAGGGHTGMPFMPMTPMMGGQDGGGEHKARQRLVGDSAELFGVPDPKSPPVLGEEE